jgi:hypothetical protein
MTDDELLAVIAETITDALTDFDAELRAANTLCLHAIVAALEVHQPGVMRTTAGTSPWPVSCHPPSAPAARPRHDLPRLVGGHPRDEPALCLATHVAARPQPIDQRPVADGPAAEGRLGDAGLAQKRLNPRQQGVKISGLTHVV